MMGPKRVMLDRFESPLSWVEKWIYFAGTVWTISYLGLSVYRDSVKYEPVLHPDDFQKGWSWLGRNKDISNFEWTFWYEIFWKVWPWYLGHLILGKVMECYAPMNRKYVFLVFSLICVSYLGGVLPLVLYLVHCSLMYTVSLTGNTKLTWAVALCALTTLNFEPFISMMKSLIDDDEYETWYYFLMFTIALINIRCTSFCLEKCWNSQEQQTIQENQRTDMYKQRKPGTNNETRLENKTEKVREAVGYSFIDLLSYVFYLPLYFTGPILTYNFYKEQMNAPLPENTKPHIKLQTLHLLRICFWAMFNEFLLHFLYFNALQHNNAVLRTISLFSLAGIGYSHGQFFMTKYLVMFGLPGTIAKFDYLNPPDPPNCISYIYLYSDMWKCFDKGLYSFLKRYIYVPCGGSKTGFLHQLLGSVLCFTYIFYWHGAEYYILLWILVNYMGIMLEKIGSAICSIPVVIHIESNILSAAMVQRIHAFFSIPIFLISCFSMFCFFGGKTVGYIFFKRLVLEGTPGSFAVLAGCVYCSIQNAIETNRWVLRRKKEKQS